jgi:hypothetical protein
MPSNFPFSSQQMYSSKQSQYYTQANSFPFQLEFSDNGAKVSFKRGRSAQDEIKKERKKVEEANSKEGEYWLNQHSASSRYTAVIKEESEDQEHKTGPENTPKPPPLYTNGVKYISSLIQPLEEIAKQQYEIKALSDNQVKVQHKTLKCYGKIVNSWLRIAQNFTAKN